MWLAKQIHLVPSDLALKHKTMKRDAFLFFRSTFYRWMQVAHPCTRWVGRRRTCIWGPPRRSERSSETSPHESPNGCIGLQNRWQVHHSATGGSGKKPNPASREVLSTTPNELEHWVHSLSLISRQGESPYCLSQYWTSSPMGFELT